MLRKRIACLLVNLLALCQACGGAAAAQKTAPGMPSPPAPEEASMDHATTAGMPGGAEAAIAPEALTSTQGLAQAQPGPQPAPGAPPTPRPTRQSETSQPVLETDPTATTAADAQRRRAMLDIEAHLTLEVENIQQAAQKLRQLTVASGGDIASETITERLESPHAQFTLRIPTTAADDFLTALGKVGDVKSRNVVARDIGKEYFDAALRLKSLRWALARYEKILEQAQKVDEVLRVEQEVARVQAQIEQVEGQLRWFRDRAARATVHVTLQVPGTYVAPVAERPEAKFYPGLRLSYLADFRGDDGTAGYFGGGVSLRLSRHLGIDIEGLRSVDGDGSGLDLLLLTLGGELYSEFFGDGQRRWFNPYLGFRAGYARFLGKNEVVAGGAIGVEILRSDAVNVDLEARIMALFASSAGAHVAVQPGVGLNVAF